MNLMFRAIKRVDENHSPTNLLFMNVRRRAPSFGICSLTSLLSVFLFFFRGKGGGGEGLWPQQVVDLLTFRDILMLWD